MKNAKILETRKEYMGYVYTHARNMIAMIIDTINSTDGTATIYFGYDGIKDRDREKTAYAFASICKKHKYIVTWPEDVGAKIGIDVSDKDFPTGFYKILIQNMKKFYKNTELNDILIAYCTKINKNYTIVDNLIQIDEN